VLFGWCFDPAFANRADASVAGPAPAIPRFDAILKAWRAAPGLHHDEASTFSERGSGFPRTLSSLVPLPSPGGVT